MKPENFGRRVKEKNDRKAGFKTRKMKQLRKPKRMGRA